MTTRREFLTLSSAALATAAFSPLLTARVRQPHPDRIFHSRVSRLGLEEDP